MRSPPPIPTVTAAPTRTGGAWWSARAALAQRRTRRFAVRWSIGVGATTAIALAAPFVERDAGANDRAALEALAADTLRSAERVRVAERLVVTAESTLVAARATAPASAPAAPTASTAPAAPAARVPGIAPDRAPEAAVGAMPASVADLAHRIDAARRMRTAGALLEVAAHPALSGGPRMRATADSIRALDSIVTGPQRSQRLARLGVSVIAMAVHRRDVLLAEAGVPSDSVGRIAAAPTPALAAPNAIAVTELPRAGRENAGTRDTLVLAEALAAARDTLIIRQREHAALGAALRSRDASPAGSRPLLARLVPAFALLALLVVGLMLRFVTALRSELDAPTLADASEAERLTGARVLTTVRDALLDGPARFKPSGVDPFRMLYLGLTATGTRARTAVVTGPDLEISAATGARLAIAAAADHRNTLIVDLDPSAIALSRTFRERAEPGVRDVLARAFSWREVARPVGSSDGLTITLLPAGTERDDEATGVAREAVLAEFEQLQGAYELTLAVAPLPGIDLAMSLLPKSPVLLTAVVGDTSIDALVAAVENERRAGRRVAGLVIWDAPRPQLPTRAVLAAELSKRKGRTPGGSFEAVRQVIARDNKDIKRP